MTHAVGLPPQAQPPSRPLPMPDAAGPAAAAPAAGATPQITVVVPAYNAARHLPDTLRSVLAQHDVDLEVIVVDDRSVDETPRIVEAFARRDARVRYACTPSNCGGPAGPRNLGIQQARAPWIAFCDADDLWHADKLRLQLEWARTTGADLVCSAIEDFVDGTTPGAVGRQVAPGVEARRLGFVGMLLKCRVATSSVLCRRDSLLRAGGFATDRQLVAVEDYDLWLRLMRRRAFRVVRLDVPLVAYRRLPDSLSANKVRHVRKVVGVLSRAFRREGWGALFPLAVPLLLASYALSSVYFRVIRGRL